MSGAITAVAVGAGATALGATAATAIGAGLAAGSMMQTQKQGKRQEALVKQGNAQSTMLTGGVPYSQLALGQSSLLGA